MKHEFRYVDELDAREGGEDVEGERRPLHGKRLWFERDDACLYVLGSSNFTTAGMGLSRKNQGNLELNVLYMIPDSGSEFARICRETAAPSIPLDLDEEEVSFLEGMPERTPDGGEQVALPEAFGEAIFDPRAGLTLEVGWDAPDGFLVLGQGDSAVLDGAAWRESGRPAHSRVPWPFAQPPSHVMVTWPQAGGVTLRGIWPVNVVDTSLLPPAEELRELTLDELVEILTSAQPTYDVMRRILLRRTRDKTKVSGPAIDPHKRVETRGFLLKRMARVGLALEGLRERLQRPVHSLEGLQWRLEGPVGPLALARRLAAEERDGASFMIAEVAQTVADVRPETAGGVSKASVQGQTERVLEALRQLAATHPAPPSLAQYVAARFAELQR